MSDRIDVEGLEMIARGSNDGEGYLVVTKGDGFRIGLLAHVTNGSITYSMEFLVRVMDREHAVDPARMVYALGVTKALTGRGYALTNEDDGWIYAERQVDPAQIDEERRFLSELVDLRNLV